MSSPLVSCLLPTARRPEWARQVFRMIEEQTYKNLELVIVNSGEPISGLPAFAREVPALKKGFPEQNGQTITEGRGEIISELLASMVDGCIEAEIALEHAVLVVRAGNAHDSRADDERDLADHAAGRPRRR